MPSTEAASGVSVRNTFLHYNFAGTAGSCRSLSCPPPARYSASLWEDTELTCTASGEDASSSIGRMVREGKLAGMRPTLARCNSHTAASLGSKTVYSVPGARLDKDVVLAAIAQGPPPYAPPSRKKASWRELDSCRAQAHEVSDGHLEISVKGSARDVTSVPESLVLGSSETGNAVEVRESSGETGVERSADSVELSEVIESNESGGDDAGGWAVVEVKRKKRPQLAKKGTTELVATSSQHLPVQPSSTRMQLSDQSIASARCLREAVGTDTQKQECVGVGHPSDIVDLQEDSTSADDSHLLNDATDSDADDAVTGDLGIAQVALDPVVCIGGQPGIVGLTSQPRSTIGSSLARSVAGPPIHHEVHVGIEHTLHFPVVRRLIGPGGVNMRRISSACPSTKVELRGAGTNPWLGGESGPLVLHIRGRDRLQCAEALKLANELISGVRKEHEEFLARAKRVE